MTVPKNRDRRSRLPSKNRDRRSRSHSKNRDRRSQLHPASHCRAAFQPPCSFAHVAALALLHLLLIVPATAARAADSAPPDAAAGSAQTSDDQPSDKGNPPEKTTDKKADDKKADDKRVDDKKTTDKKADDKKADDKKAPKGKLLFDGKTLKGWKKTDFVANGDIRVKDGQLMLGYGEMLTGVTYDGKPPKTNYELTLEAQRVDGSDFFCGLTFPVGKGHCSLILGGWGGSLVGLSSIDGYDASENETTCFERFETGRWYKVRVRVTDAKVEAWLGKRQLIDVDRKDKEFTVRWEVEPSRPLGIASFQTTAAVKNVRLQRLTEKATPEKGKATKKKP